MTSSLALLVGFVIALPVSGWAYVCSRVPDENGNETGPSLSWFSRSLTYALQKNGTTDIADDAEFNELRESFAVWKNNLADPEGSNCSSSSYPTDIQLTEASSLSASTRVGYDFLNPTQNENLLLFQDGVWPHAGTGGIILALTTNTYNSLTGEIFDADIEFNSAGFDFTTSGDLTIKTDLKNTAVHEIGHFLGLGHTSIDSATMYEQAVNGETKKRDLDCDDAEANGFKYPTGQENGYCTPSEDCGFCAPPGLLSATVKIDVTGSNPDSTTGCQCTSVEVSWYGFGWLLMLLRRRRRT